MYVRALKLAGLQTSMTPSLAVPLNCTSQEYYSRILKKLKEVGATSDRTNFYV